MLDQAAQRAFFAVRGKASTYTVLQDGVGVGRVKLDRATFGGWIAYLPGAERALLTVDGDCAQVYSSRDAAADALVQR